MVLLYSLSADCGEDEADAAAFLKHFDGFIAVLDDGSSYPCFNDIFTAGDAYWVRICPDGVSCQGVGSQHDERVMTAVGLAMYEQLRSAPRYRHAVVGVQVDGALYYSEIDAHVIENDYSGLVISDDLWASLGTPDIFVPFVSGYRWRPFVRAR